MPKTKLFLKENKKKLKQSNQAPTTADDFLAAGVEYEEAGEKWRGGDAAKSARFFVRAINNYDDALKLFPESFDLAYNKARVQYEIIQHPRIVAQLPVTPLELLDTALDSSRYALRLQQDNADILFNTAQVLTSYAETISESPGAQGGRNRDIFDLLEEAIEIFQRCLTLQEFQYSEGQSLSKSVNFEASQDMPTADVDNMDEGSQSVPESEVTAQEERWATIVEPVTNDTLLDTILAQLETLTSLCGLINLDQSKGLSWVEEYSTTLIREKLPHYVQDTDRQEEAALTRANFIAALADANYRSHRIDIATFERALEDAYKDLDLSNDAEGLCERAEALISYDAAVRLVMQNNQQPEAVLNSRWKALTAALEGLTAAAKLSGTDETPRIQITRGDVELLRFQLGQAPSSFGVAARNAATLVKNAGTYYRGAALLATTAGLGKVTKEASVKEAVAAALGGNTGPLEVAAKADARVLQEVSQECIEEGLVSIEWVINTGVIKLTDFGRGHGVS